MKKRKSLMVFISFFVILMVALYMTESKESLIYLKERPISFSTPANFTVENVFKPEGIAELASEMFDYKGIRTGLINIESTGFTKLDLGVEESVVNITEVLLDDGRLVSYIEPKTEVVDMYNNVSNTDLLVVIIEEQNGVKRIIREQDSDFDYYKQSLLKEKRAIQTTKLTNLELLLAESRKIGSYEAYLSTKDNLIRTSTIYYSEKENYMLMLSKDKQDVEYFLVDADVDMVFDHIYEIGTEFLEVNGYITANELEHLLYRTFIQMIDLETEYFETKFKGEVLIVKHIKGDSDEE